jgi:hypothetical protein
LFLGRWRPRVVAVLVCGSLVLAAGGVAWATIPDAGTQVIHACYDKTTGALRVIDPSKSQACTGSESALSWNGRGLNFRGAWSATASYAISDVVAIGGGTFVAKAANTNSKPPSASWAVLGEPSFANIVSKSNQEDPGFPVILSSNLKTIVQTTGLPAGNYSVNASITVFVDNDAQDLQCFLSDGHGNFPNGYAETSGPPDSTSGSPGSVQTISLTDAFQNEPAGTSIRINCAIANGADPNTSEVVSASISANQVGHMVLNGISSGS